MDSLSLLAVAREAGLAVRADGDKLVVRGPRAAEALAREILEHKAELMIVLRPASSASSSIWRSCRRSYLLGDGSAVDQSTQVFTVLNPRSLIFFRSSRQTSRCLSGSGSSIGARALPPPYHTANGKKGSSMIL